MLIDSHCHLDDSQFDPDRDQVVERALAAGVERMVAIGTGDGPPDLEAGIRLAERYDCMFATIGVHPQNAAAVTPETYRRLEELATHPKVIAIGEIGLDYHRDEPPRDLQEAVFIEQLRLARDRVLPVCIHTRDAWDDTFRLLEEHWRPAGLPGILHCFTGGPDEARRALDLGFCLSFAGIVTFPKATGIHEAARMTPLDRLLIETDAPYLAPVPNRGKRNEPACMVSTAHRLAELRGETFQQVCDATSANFSRLMQPAAGLLPSKPYEYTGNF